MRTIVCNSHSDAIAVQKSLPEARVIWPCRMQFTVFSAEVIEVMPGVDLDQDLEGMKLLQLIKSRQKTFLDPRIEIISGHERLAIMGGQG